VACGALLEDRIAVIEVTGKNPRGPLQERYRGRRDARYRRLTRGLIGVGAHLLDPAAALGSPGHGGPRLGVRVGRPGRVLILPAIDHVGPPLGLGRLPGRPGGERGEHGGQRVFLDPAPRIEPPDPALQGGDPALRVGRPPEFSHQLDSAIDVPGGHGVLQRFPGQVIARAPGGGAAPQDRDQGGLQPFQLREQHVAEQVVVAVPLAAVVQRHQQHVGSGQFGQHRSGAGQFQHRLAQRPGHALQHRGPGQELPLGGGDPGQELRFHVLGHEQIATAERPARDRQAAGPDGQRRQVQPRRPPLGPPVQLGHQVLGQGQVRVAQQRGGFRGRQRQLGRADLDDPALGPQPRDPQRRRLPPGQHQPRPGRHVIGQHRQRGQALGVPQQVHVI